MTVDELTQKLAELEPRLPHLSLRRRTASLAEIAGRLRVWHELNPEANTEAHYRVRCLFGRITRLVGEWQCGFVVAAHGEARCTWNTYVAGMAALANGVEMHEAAAEVFWEEHLLAIECVVDGAPFPAIRPVLQQALEVVPGSHVLERLMLRTGMRNPVRIAVLAERERCVRIASKAGAVDLANAMRCA
jgi:hypothetical protein